MVVVNFSPMASLYGEHWLPGSGGPVKRWYQTAFVVLKSLDVMLRVSKVVRVTGSGAGYGGVET